MTTRRRPTTVAPFPVGDQQITSLSVPTALTAPAVAAYAWIQAESQDIRWRDSGSAPTASVGNLLRAGETLEYDGDLSAIRLIEVVAGAKANVTYYIR